MSELYLKPLQAYIRDLCVKHKLLQHNDVKQKVFIRFQTEESLGAIKGSAGKYFVIMDNITGRAIGEFDENRIRQELSLLFLKRAATPAGKPYEVVEQAQQDALEIMFDFYARLKEDYYEDDCGPLKSLKPEQMTFEPVSGPVEEFHYGWLMTIPFDLNAPAYDPDKWINE